MEESPNKRSKTRPIRSKAAHSAMRLQELLMRDAESGEITASVRAQLARAWVDLQEMRLRLAMKPAPKPVDVEAYKRRKSGGNTGPTLAPAV